MRFLVVISTCAALGFGAVPAMSQDTNTEVDHSVFPDEAMDGLMRVTFANTADAKCDGMTARSLRVQRAMLSMLTGVAELGGDPVEAVSYLETPEAQERIAERELAFREKHGVDAEGDEALCTAIRLEAKEDKELARLMRIK